ncbi:unnamed protein product [Scytosiphon promiscuus]
MVIRCYWWGVALCVAAFLSGASTLSTSSYPACSSLPGDLHSSILGNGVCNEAFNTEDCGYDGGDCCPCTCKSGPEGPECGTTGYNCVDPTVSCFVEPVLSIRYLQSSDAYADSLSPTSTPTASPTADSMLDDLAETLSSSSSGLSEAAVGAIVGVCVVAAIIVGIYCLYKRSRRGDDGPDYAAAGSTNLA